MAASVIYTAFWLIVIANVVYWYLVRREGSSRLGLFVAFTAPVAFGLGALLHPIALPAPPAIVAAAPAAPAPTATCAPVAAGWLAISPLAGLSGLKKLAVDPQGSIDVIRVSSSPTDVPTVLQNNPVAAGGRLFVGGWLHDPRMVGGPRQVFILVDGRHRIPAAGDVDQARPDVVAALQNPAALHSGFNVQFDTKLLNRGTHTFQVAGVFGTGSGFEVLNPPNSFIVR